MARQEESQESVLLGGPVGKDLKIFTNAILKTLLMINNPDCWADTAVFTLPNS